ncbi:MAG: PAS domain-containing protein [Acidimicrobiales bacterium]|nr:PAS domain-containing protein [Acidimicrobiales bacterium]
MSDAVPVDEIDSARLALAAFDGLPVHAAVIDPDGRIALTNAGWDEFGDLNGAPGEPWVERNYLDECDRAAGEGVEDAAIVANALRGVLRGRLQRRVFVYNCDSPDERRVFRMAIGAVHFQDAIYAVIVHDNVTPQ